jgi:SAM-dependent methyltransferase
MAMLNVLKGLRTRLGDKWTQRLRTGVAPLLRFAERLVFGGEMRRAALRAMWLAHMNSSIRRDLWWTGPDEVLHFSTHTETLNLFVNGSQTVDVRNFNRAFLTSQMIDPGDTVFEIGCGEGFFTKRFYSYNARYVDAIDIEADAIRRALKRNADDKIHYFQGDAVALEPPRAPYDVIIWDGAIGHFSAAATERLLDKIVRALRPDGVFCGSESLGDCGGDHLQGWETLEDLAALLRRYFQHVDLFESHYPMGERGQHLRREAYWRCANVERRLAQKQWRRF